VRFLIFGTDFRRAAGFMALLLAAWLVPECARAESRWVQSLAQSKCGGLGQIAVIEETVPLVNEAGETVTHKVLEVVWLDPILEKESQTLWGPERNVVSIRHLAPTYRALVECDPQRGLGYVVLLSQSSGEVFGRMVRVNLPSAEGLLPPEQEVSDSGPAQVIAAPVIADFSFSVVYMAGKPSFSTKRMGDHVMFLAESTVGDLWNGRAFLLDFGEGEASEIRFVEGRAKHPRIPGHPNFFDPDQFGYPKPWEGVPGDVLKPRQDGDSVVDLQEPTESWFRCSSLADCAVALDECGEFVGVARTYWAVYDQWTDNLPLNMKCPFGSLDRSRCEATLICRKERCEVLLTNGDSEVECAL